MIVTIDVIGYMSQVKYHIVFTTGAGKSKIISALLWHLFQYDSSNMVLVTSFTWKAADLIGTPYNPGYSSCTTFGINPMARSRGSTGQSAAAHALLNPNVVLVINDEISFTHQSHLQVLLCMNEPLLYVL